VIVVAVRCYLRFNLSYRDVEELLVESGVEVDHVTVYRWCGGSRRCWPTGPDRTVAADQNASADTRQRSVCNEPTEVQPVFRSTGETRRRAPDWGPGRTGDVLQCANAADR
jgi:hypothetical protein